MKEKNYSITTICTILFWGFLLNFFSLNISYLADITTGIGMLLLWYGCFILRKENQALNKTFIMASCILGIFTFVEIIQATPLIDLSLVGVLSNVCILILLYQYGLGMQELNQTYGGETIVQCKRIFYEYIVIIALMIFSLFVPTVLVYIGIVIFIVIMVQIYRIHKIVKEHVKDHEFTCRFVPVIPAGIAYAALMIAIIMASTYVVHTNLTSDYDMWKTSTSDERISLVEKGLSQKVSEDLSDDTIKALEKVKAFHVYKENQNDDYPKPIEEYVGIDEEGFLYHVIWIDFEQVDFNGNCSMIPLINSSQENQTFLETEVAFLYDQDNKTYGRKEASQSFDVNTAKGDHPRGYVYSKSKVENDQLIDLSTNIIYQESWFQYPYVKQSLTESYSQSDDIFASMMQMKNYKTKFHLITVDTRDFKDHK